MRRRNNVHPGSGHSEICLPPAGRLRQDRRGNDDAADTPISDPASETGHGLDRRLLPARTVPAPRYPERRIGIAG